MWEEMLLVYLYVDLACIPFLSFSLTLGVGKWLRIVTFGLPELFIWTASSEFGTYRLWKQRSFRQACASAQSRQNLRCSLIQAVNQEEPSDRKPGPWLLRMAGHAQLKFVMTECSKTQIRLTGLISAFITLTNDTTISLYITVSCHKCKNFKAGENIIIVQKLYYLSWSVSAFL